MTVFVFLRRTGNCAYTAACVMLVELGKQRPKYWLEIEDESRCVLAAESAEVRCANASEPLC